MPERARHLPLATLASTVAVAIAEAARVPFGLYAERPSLFFATFALSLEGLLVRFAPTVAALVALGVLALFPGAMRRPGRLRVVLELGAAAVVCLSLYRILVRYEPFQAVLSPKLAFAALVPVVALGLGDHHERTHTRTGRLLARALIASLLVGAGACLVIDRVALPGDYPTLHLTLLGVAHLLLALGGLQLLELFRSIRSPGPKSTGLAVGVLVAVLAIPRVVGGARPYYLSYTDLGRARSAFEPYSTEGEVPRANVPDDPDAALRFEKMSGLPSLPVSFDLSRYNVLVIGSEATRYDQTSLADPALGTTPHLVRFAAGGAFHFTRAYSPSSSTLLSLAAMFGMSYPSLLPLETWKKPWTGRLSATATTAAEVLAREGYDTFWIGHDSRSYFSKAGVGLDQGFATRELFGAGPSIPPDVDRTIADRAVGALAERRGSARRFFGFVFFVSPHSPYLVHDRTRPVETALDLYQQEIRYVDEQIGRVLAALDASGAARDTIVVYLGDHGEEFWEHGGVHHKATVYEESVHVPLLIRIPEVPGRTMSGPTSTMHLFPWLFLRGTEVMRRAASERLVRDIGPMLRATEGAVVCELLGHDRMKAGLVYGRHTFLYDFVAERHEAYATDRDPGNLRDRFGIDAAMSLLATERVDAYRNVRAARRRFVLRPLVEDPRGTLRAE